MLAFREKEAQSAPETAAFASSAQTHQTKSVFSCLFTKQKTQKRKKWHDGRLVVKNGGSAAILYHASPPPGSGDPILDQCELAHNEVLRIGNSHLETEKFLITIEDPWTGPPPSFCNHLSNKSQPLMSNAMHKVLTKKFRQPIRRAPPPPHPTVSTNANLAKRRRPLQPGELVRQYYGNNQQDPMKNPMSRRPPDHSLGQPSHHPIPNTEMATAARQANSNPRSDFSHQGRSNIPFSARQPNYDTTQNGPYPRAPRPRHLPPSPPNHESSWNSSSGPATAPLYAEQQQPNRNGNARPTHDHVFGHPFDASPPPAAKRSQSPPSALHPPPPQQKRPNVFASNNGFDASNFYGDEEDDDDDDNNNGATFRTIPATTARAAPPTAAARMEPTQTDALSASQILDLFSTQQDDVGSNGTTANNKKLVHPQKAATTCSTGDHFALPDDSSDNDSD